MKKSKLLLLVLVTPLLTGCGSSVKAPKFAKEGNEVAGDKFVADFANALASCAFAKTDALGSAEAKVKTSYSTESDWKRDGKKFSSGSDVMALDGQFKYDAANAIFDQAMTSKAKVTSQSKHGKSETTETAKGEGSIEAAQVNGANYLVNVNKTAKEYSPLLLLEGDVTAAKALDAYMKNMMYAAIQEMYITEAQWAATSDEEKAHYKFFENGNVFTWTYERKVENEETKDADDQVTRVYNRVYNVKHQLDFTAGKLVYLFYSEDSETFDYKKAQGSYAAGDVRTEVDKRSEELHYNDKDVKLKAAKLDKFAAIGF